MRWWRCEPVRRRPSAPLCDAHGVPGQRIGTVGGDSLVADGCFAIPLTELAAGHGQTLPALFG